MAVPKKKSSRQRSQRRYKTYMKRRQKKLLNFVERAKRNERGAAIVAEQKRTESSENVTKIVA